MMSICRDERKKRRTRLTFVIYYQQLRALNVYVFPPNFLIYHIAEYDYLIPQPNTWVITKMEFLYTAKYYK